MSEFEHKWQRIIALARQVDEDRDLAAPLGFATRVCAQATALPAAASWQFLERLALRGLALAAVCSAIAVASNLSVLTTDQADAYLSGNTGTTDTLVELLDLT